MNKAVADADGKDPTDAVAIGFFIVQEGLCQLVSVKGHGNWQVMGLEQP